MNILAPGFLVDENDVKLSWYTRVCRTRYDNSIPGIRQLVPLPFKTLKAIYQRIRDMCFVQQAFETAGYRLLYSRNKQQPGYYLDGQPALSPEIKQVLMGTTAEVDQRQIDIYRKLSFAERFHQGCSISDTARNVVAYRIRQENPRMSLMEANRMALQRAYSQ